MQQLPINIEFHNVEHSKNMYAVVTNMLERLEAHHFKDKIKSCNIVIDKPHKQHSQGNKWRVSVSIHIPRKNISSHADDRIFRKALSNAFEKMERQLEHHYTKIAEKKKKKERENSLKNKFDILS